MALTEAERCARYAATEKGRASRAAVQRRYNARIKLLTIEAYGGRCACCGEANPVFLTIDHANNDGAAHRGATRASGNALYQLLKQEGWPKDRGLRVLCFNCNCGRAVNGGVCPHEEKA